MVDFIEKEKLIATFSSCDGLLLRKPRTKYSISRKSNSRLIRNSALPEDFLFRLFVA